MCMSSVPVDKAKLDAMKKKLVALNTNLRNLYNEKPQSEFNKHTDELFNAQRQTLLSRLSTAISQIKEPVMENDPILLEWTKLEYESNYEMLINDVLKAQARFKAANPKIQQDYIEIGASEMRYYMRTRVLDNLAVNPDGSVDTNSVGYLNLDREKKLYNMGLAIRKKGAKPVPITSDATMSADYKRRVQSEMTYLLSKIDPPYDAQVDKFYELKDRMNELLHYDTERVKELKKLFKSSEAAINSADEAINHIKGIRMAVWANGGGYTKKNVDDIKKLEAKLQAAYALNAKITEEIESKLILNEIISKRAEISAKIDTLGADEKEKYRKQYDGSWMNDGLNIKLFNLEKKYSEGKISLKDLKSQSETLMKEADVFLNEIKELTPEDATLSARPKSIADAYAAQSATYGVPNTVTAVTIKYSKAAADVQRSLAKRSDKEIMSLTSDDKQPLTTAKFKELNEEAVASISKETGKEGSLYEGVTTDKSEDGMSVTMNIPTEFGGMETITRTSEPIPDKEGKPSDAVKVKLSFSIPLSDRAVTMLFDKNQKLPLPLTLKDPATPPTEQPAIDARREMLIKLYQGAIATKTPINLGENDQKLLSQHPVFQQMQKLGITSYRDADKFNEKRIKYEKDNNTVFQFGRFLEPPPPEAAAKPGHP